MKCNNKEEKKEIFFAFCSVPPYTRPSWLLPGRLFQPCFSPLSFAPHFHPSSLSLLFAPFIYLECPPPLHSTHLCWQFAQWRFHFLFLFLFCCCCMWGWCVAHATRRRLLIGAFFLVSIPNSTWAAAAAQAYVSKSSRALTSHGKWRNTWRGLVAEKKGPRVGSRHLFGLPCVCVSPSLSLSGGVLLLLPFLFQKVPILLRCNREKGPPRWITLRVRVAVRRWEVVGDTAAVCVASGRGARAGSNSFGCQSESNFAAD